jgi:hypothetical protein
MVPQIVFVLEYTTAAVAMYRTLMFAKKMLPETIN